MSQDQTCTSYFLNEAAMETIPWLHATIMKQDNTDTDTHTHPHTQTHEDDEGIEGKLICPNPKCKSRLGSFNWSGSQCSCGSWVVPAVQIVASKVDRKTVEDTVGLVVVDFHATAAAVAAAAAAAKQKEGEEGGEQEREQGQRQQREKEEGEGEGGVVATQGEGEGRGERQEA